MRVVYNQGSYAYPGQMAVVVCPEEFPSYLKTMEETIGHQDVFEHFVAVRWIPSFSYPNKPEDGFYSKARFEVVNNIARG